MVSTTSPRSSYDDRSGSRPGPPPTDEDWPAQVADSIERIVGSVRDKTTGPALTVAKVVVYGTFAALVAVVALVLFIVGFTRFLNAYLPDSVFGDKHMWVVYLITGLIFATIGGFLWSRRRAPEQTSRY